MNKLIMVLMVAVALAAVACADTITPSPQDMQDLQNWAEREATAAAVLNDWQAVQPREVKCFGISQPTGFTCKYNELTTSDPALVLDLPGAGAVQYFRVELLLECEPTSDGTWRPNGNVQLGADAPLPDSQMWMPTREELWGACDVIPPLDAEANR